MNSYTTENLRVWTNPHAKKDKPSLLFLKPEALCLAQVPADDLEKTAAALAAGTEVVCLNIPLTSITQLQGYEGDKHLSITYSQGKARADSVTVTLVDGSKRDELFDALRDRLGTTWTCERSQESRFSASVVPFWVTVVALISTLAFIVRAVSRDLGNKQNPVGAPPNFVPLVDLVIGLLGTTGVVIVGAVVAGICILWLVRMVAHPPILMTVRRK